MAGRIPSEFIADLLLRIDIVELIDARLPLKKAGRNYQACCPFHSEKTPSFSVSPLKQFYHCFGCGASGNAIGFIMAYDRLDFVPAVELLARQAGIEVVYAGKDGDERQSLKNKAAKNLYDILTAAKAYYQQQLKQSPQAQQYLRERGMGNDVIVRYGIGWAGASWDGLLKHIGSAHQDLLLAAGLISESHKNKNHPYHDKFHQRIMFPIHDRQGRVLGFGGRIIEKSENSPKYLNSPETPVFHKSQVLYGLYEARQANMSLEHLIVVEGYMDVVALAEAGISCAVATLGTATTLQHIQQLLQHVHQIIFCFDGDAAGQKAAWRALETALPLLQDDVAVRFLFLPEGEDPDSLVQKEGAEAFRERLKHAMPLADFFFARLKPAEEMAGIESRTRFADAALPRIMQIGAPILREMMLDKLSSLVRLDIRRLEKSAKNKNSVSENNRPPAGLQKTPMRLAIALLLQYPALMTEMARREAPNAQMIKIIDALDMPGSEVLKAVFHQITELALSAITPHTAMLLEYWRDAPFAALLHKLAAWEHGVPEAGIVAEWQGVLSHLQKQQREHEIAQLLKQLSAGAISDSDRTRLQLLLAEKG